MTNLILQPAGNADSREHYQDTVKSLVRIKDIEHLLSGEEKRRLEINYPYGEFSCWGVTPSNKKKWEKIERGDVTFFSRSGRIFARATATFKSEMTRMATRLEYLEAERSEMKMMLQDLCQMVNEIKLILAKNQM